MASGETIMLIVFIAAMLASALFSATEAAYLSIQRGRLAALIRSDPERARKVERFAGSPEKLLATVLTGNNLANTAAAALGTGLALSYLSANNAVIASTIGVTVLLLIFGEVIPKTIATRHSVGLAMLMAVPLRVVETLLLPPIWVLERIVRGVTWLLRLPDTSLVSHEEIIALVDVGLQSGSVEPVQAEMVGNVFRVEDRQLKEVMTPRTEIIGIRHEATLQDFLDLYRQNPHSRYPVYAGDMDHIVGILSVNDVVGAIANHSIQPEDNIAPYAQPAYIAPETRMLGRHLRELQGIGHQMVVLADEYGGVAGLVSRREIVEEIVGPMWEPDEPLTMELRSIDANTFHLDGGLDVDEANRQLGLAIPDGDYETIAGFLLVGFGVIPKVGDYLQHSNFVFEVSEMEGIKIEKVTVTRKVSSDEMLE